MLTQRIDSGFCVYILASRSKNVYTGVTNNLFRRMVEHKREMTAGFTARYRVCRLVHVESFRYVRDAIAREKQIKGWTRAKKLALIEKDNPGWYDLAEDWVARKSEMQIPRCARHGGLARNDNGWVARRASAAEASGACGGAARLKPCPDKTIWSRLARF